MKKFNYTLLALSLLITAGTTQAQGFDTQQLQASTQQQLLLNETRENNRLLKENAELTRENNRLLNTLLSQQTKQGNLCQSSSSHNVK